MQPIDIQRVAAQALACAQPLVERWLPGGRTQGREYKVRNPTRHDSSIGSFSVNLETGAWADFATSDKGGDLVSLYAYLNNVSQLQSARSVMAEVGMGAPSAPAHAEKQFIMPVPATFLQSPATLPLPGDGRLPAVTYTYYMPRGGKAFWVCRYDARSPEEKKTYRPWCLASTGRLVQANPPGILPLYRAPDVIAKPQANVLVVEGEKAAEAAVALLPDWVVVTSAGGSNRAQGSDWSLLASRRVTIWPDNDAPGKAYATSVCEALLKFGAQVSLVSPPEGLPEKWDLADPVPPDAKWTVKQVLENAPPINALAPDAIQQHDAIPERSRFPVEALPVWMQHWVLSVSEVIQCPPDVPAALALCAVATACAGKFNIRLNRTYDEPCALYWMVALPPGERKSPPFMLGTAPIVDWEQAKAREHIKRAQVLDAQIEKLASEVKAAAKEAADKGTQQAKEVAEAKTVELDALKREKYPTTVIADDATVEALMALMSQNHGRIAMLSDDDKLSKILRGRYSNQITDLGLYLAAHGDQSYKKQRASQECINLPRALMNICITVQPTVMRTFGAISGFKTQGLSGRFLYSVPTPMSGTRRESSLLKEIPESAISGYRMRIRNLLDIPMLVDGWGNRRSRTVGVTELALRVCAQFDIDKEKELDPLRGRLRPMTEWANKMVMHMARIALVLHIAEAVDYVDSEIEERIKAPVTDITIAKAVKIMGYMAEHAARAHKMMRIEDPDIPETEGEAQRTEIAKLSAVFDACLAVAENTHPPQVKMSDAYKRVGCFSEAEIKTVFKELVAKRYLLPVGNPRGSGRMTSRYAINARSLRIEDMTL